jgi:putative endopeptidase
MHRLSSTQRLTTIAAILLAGTLLPAHMPAAAQSAPQPAELKVFDPSLIDTSIDPCDNFYKYSCNGWFKRNPLPADQVSYGRFTELSEINRAHLRAILEAAAVPSPTRTANEQKIGDEYASCMDVAAINARGTQPFQADLDRIAALHDRKQLPDLLAHLHREGIGAFFDVGSDQDLSDSTQVIANFAAGGLGLPERDYYTRTDPKSVEQRQQYVQHVTNMLKLLGESQQQAASDAQSILALETRLAKASLTVTEMRDPQALNHPMQLADFEKTLSGFNLAAYVDAEHAPPIRKINVLEPKFYAELNSVLAATDLATIRAYLRWHFIHSIAGTSTPESFDNESFHFYQKTLRGQEEQQARWKRCTARVDHELGEALGQVYVAKYFPPDDKARAVAMTEAIEAAMDKDLDSLDWMSPETKVRAKQKLHAVANKIGYPDKWRDYTKLEITRGDALGNQERAHTFEHNREMAKIGKPVDRGEWDMTPPTVNAYYNPQMNDVNFPAGYLQPPFFSAREDDAANYGDMGSTIGHELTHGFDDEGRQFDAQGNLKDWWTKDDATRFTEKADCMVKQFDAFVPVDDVHVNGKLTLGENLADLGGLWLAYIAWEAKAETANVDMAAKTDGYTPEQRFYIAYAQQWCTQTRPEALRSQVLTNEHAPDEYRTNGILQDFPQFATAFGCKKGQAMVREHACRVW